MGRRRMFTHRACAILSAWAGLRTGRLWVAVNERDMLGDNLVPDYMTSVRAGGFYGWPYYYYGQNVDERVQPQRPELVATALAPDYALGAHTASLGLFFYQYDAFPEHYLERRLCRPARLLEPRGARRLQGGVRAVRERRAKRTGRGFSHRLPERSAAKRKAVRLASRWIKPARSWSRTMSATLFGALRRLRPNARFRPARSRAVHLVVAARRR